MRIRPLARLIGASCLLAALALIPGCSDDDGGGGTLGPPTLELNSPDLGAAATYQHTFITTGVFPYHCTRHPSMRDTIRVQVTSPNTSLSISITGSTFTPQGQTIQPNGTVTWTNNDAIVHTVTSD
jgi:hypothetical protein